MTNITNFRNSFLRVVLVSTFLPLSASFQNRWARDGSFNPFVDGFPFQSSRNAWNVLKYHFHTETVLRWQTCNSSQYDEYYESLPDIQLSAFQIPSNVRILFYGHSFLHQALDILLLANKDTLIKSGPFGGVEGDKILEDSTGYITKWDFTSNSTIVEIQNIEALQRVQYTDSLKEYLQTNGPFDIAFFMNPHLDCYFTNGNHSCGHGDGRLDYIEERPDVQPLWDVVQEVVGNNTFEVEAWSWEERETFHANDEHVIRSTTMLAEHPCNTKDGCSSDGIDGHQCQPGRLAFVSERIAAAMRQALPS